MAHILAVDDVPFNVEYLEEGLVPMGHSISGAANGREALDRIREDRPDLVLLDVSMPEMDGLEVLRRLRTTADYEDLPIILLTARKDFDDVVRGLEAGADDYITKPFNMAEVTARINALLRVQDLQRKVVDRERLAARIDGIGQTLVTLAHHINNATQAIAGMAQLCQNAPEDLPQHRQLVRISFSQATRISAVIESLREMVDRMEVRTADYAGDPDRMLDVEEALKARLDRIDSEGPEDTG